MGYRILCDENVPPQTVRYLRKAGHDAVHVSEVLGSGTDDPSVAAYASERNRLVLTNDADFLDDEKYPEQTVLYYPNNRLRPYEIAELVSEIHSALPEQANLPREVFLGDWGPSLEFTSVVLDDRSNRTRAR